MVQSLKKVLFLYYSRLKCLSFLIQISHSSGTSYIEMGLSPPIAYRMSQIFEMGRSIEMRLELVMVSWYWDAHWLLVVAEEWDLERSGHRNRFKFLLSYVLHVSSLAIILLEWLINVFKFEIRGIAKKRSTTPSMIQRAKHIASLKTYKKQKVAKATPVQ